MDLKSFFNVLLLSLSLATVLITLISFILYKLRQLTVKGQFKDPVRMEGMFFTRYAPLLEKLNQEARARVDKNHSKSGTNISLGALFVIVVGVIATSLFAETYFVELQEKKKKISVIDNYRELVRRDLLKRYDYSPHIRSQRLQLWNLEREKSETKALAQILKRSTIYFVKSASRSQSTPQEYVFWKKFLKESALSYKQGSLNKAPKSALLILPNLMDLNARDRDLLKLFLDKGHGVLVTGQGLLGKNMVQAKAFYKKYLGLKFSSCPSRESYPTLFSVDTPPWWDLQPGTKRNWYPTSDVCATQAGESMDGVAFESNYDGKIRNLGPNEPIIRGVFKNVLRGRLGWLAMAPQNVDESDRVFRDKVYLSSLIWVAQKPMTKIAAWPNGKKIGVAVGVSVLSKDLLLSKSLTLMEQKKISPTLFVPSENLEFLREVLEDQNVENLDFSAESNGMQISKNLSQKVEKSPSDYISRYDFEFVEGARMDVEEQTAQAVKGIYVDRRNWTPSLLHAILTNRLSYTVSDEYREGLHIYDYDGHPFYWFPIYFPLNEELGVHRLPATELFKSGTEKLFAQDLVLGRLLTFYTKNVTREWMGGLKRFIEGYSGSAEFFNFRNLSLWMQSRGQISVDLRSDKTRKGAYQIEVTNTGDNAVENSSLYLDFATSQKLFVQYEGSKLVLKSNEKQIVPLPRLEPKSTKTIQVYSGKQGGT